MALPFFRGPDQLDLLLGAVLCYCCQQDAPDAAQQALGAYEPCTVKVYEPTNPFEPRAMLLVSAHFALLALEGTRTWNQWVLNLLASLQTNVPPVPGQIATSFATEASLIVGAIAADLVPALPGRNFVVCGYSLGAGVGQILAAFFDVLGTPPRSVFCYGSPRVGDQVFASSFAVGELLRLAITDDAVPNLPPELWGNIIVPLPFPFPPVLTKYTHGGAGYQLAADGSIKHGESVSDKAAIIRTVQSPNVVTPHLLETYITYLLQGIPVSSFIPGSDGYPDPGEILNALWEARNVEMQTIVSQNALSDTITNFADQVSTTPYLVRLFTNNITPTVLTVTGDFTTSGDPGLVAQNMPGHLPPVWDGVSKYNVQFNAITFTWSGAGLPPTVYGYFVTTPGGTLWFSCELWPSGFTFSLLNQSVSFIPGLSDRNE